MRDKILITGGAGFIGFHLASLLLDSGYDITIIDNLSRGLIDTDIKDLEKKGNIRILNLNILDANSLTKIPLDYKYIFHLAAIIGVANVLSQPYNVLYDNISMLGNVINFARRQKKLKRFLFASTSEVYAGTLKFFSLKIPSPESSYLALTELNHPRTSYMLSKIYGEAMCLHSGLPITIFRPHNIYGPRMGLSHVIPEQLKKAEFSKNNDTIEVSSVDHTRTFCYIYDAIEMLVLMMKNNSCEGKTLNLGNQSPEVSIRKVVEICHSVVGKNFQIRPIPDLLNSPSRRSPDMTKTYNLINYTPSISLQEGITKTYNWYKLKVFLGGGLSAK